MMKCGACGKFLSASDCIRCTKCDTAFHKACVAIPGSASVRASWTCPGCKIKIPREDNTSTPVKGIADAYTPGSPVRLDDTALNTTEEFKIDFGLEIRSFRNELKAARHEVHQCRVEISEFKATLSSFDVKISEIEGRLTTLENNFAKIAPSNTDTFEETIAELKAQLNERDQAALLNDIEISGFPEQSGENISNVVSMLSTTLGVPFDDKDVVMMERVGSTRRNRVEGVLQRPRTIAVRFARRAIRDQWLHAARVRRSLSTADVGGVTDKPKGDSGANRIYINERLSRSNRKLFFQAREAGKKYNWKYVWSRDGKILARKEDGQSALLIRHDKDITNFF